MAEETEKGDKNKLEGRDGQLLIFSCQHSLPILWQYASDFIWILAIESHWAGLIGCPGFYYPENKKSDKKTENC